MVQNPLADASGSSKRRDILRFASLAGLSGVTGATALSASSQPSLAISGSVSLGEGLTAGEATVQSFDLHYANLDTESDIVVNYILRDSTGTILPDSGGTETNTISEATGVVTAGSTTITIPDGQLSFQIEVTHPSLESPIRTTPSELVTVSSPVSDVDISSEEGGSLSAWNGDMNTTAVSSSTISGSGYSIELSTDTTERYLQTTFPQGEYERFSFYVYPWGENSEVIFYNTNTGEPAFCIYFSGYKDSMNYSDPADTNNQGWSGDNLVGGTRTSGLTIKTGVAGSYQHVEVYPDWQNETCDVYLNGSQVLTDVTFSSTSGVVDSCVLTHNHEYSATGGAVDKIKGLTS